METNKKVKDALRKANVTMEELGSFRNVSKQAISQMLKAELPAEKQDEMCRQIIEIASDRLRALKEGA